MIYYECYLKYITFHFIPRVMCRVTSIIVSQRGRLEDKTNRSALGYCLSSSRAPFRYDDLSLSPSTAHDAALGDFGGYDQ